jgi:hypothetical protein
MALLVWLPESSGRRIRSFPLSVSFYHGSACSHPMAWGWTIGPLVAAVQRRRLTPSILWWKWWWSSSTLSGSYIRTTSAICLWSRNLRDRRNLNNVTCLHAPPPPERCNGTNGNEKEEYVCTPTAATIFKTPRAAFWVCIYCCGKIKTRRENGL